MVETNVANLIAEIRGALGDESPSTKEKRVGQKSKVQGQIMS